MNYKFLCLFILIFILSTTIAVKASDIPDWHKPIPCVGCHKETLGAGDGGEDVCGDCHKYKYSGGGINVPAMEAEHNPNICTACHIGSTKINGSERDVFHNAHNTVQCIECHLSQDNTVLRIKEGKAFQCVGCHGSKIHGIHAANLSKACPICHGSWAAGKVYAPSIPQKHINTNTNLEELSISTLIKNIFNTVFENFGLNTSKKG